METFRMSCLLKETDFPSLSVPLSQLLNTGGQQCMAPEQFGEDTHVRAMLNA